MRTIHAILIAACFGLCGSTTHAAESDLAKQAEAAYASGDHEKALALFDSLNNTHTSSGLLYNIGNCYSKLGDVPHAILFYERSLRLAPGAEDVQANLDLERAKVVDRVNELPGFALASIWDRLQGGSDVDQWARRSLWACALMAVFAGVSIFVRQRMAKRGLIALAAIAMLVTVISMALAAYRVEQVRNTGEAIIMQPKVDVLSEPRDGASAAFVLHQGTKVQVLKRQGDWQEVKIPSGAVGWLPGTACETI
jgi:tetratricopeptide (TPR) repeat protein